MTSVPWRGRVFLDAGLILYVGPGASAEEHAHNAVQLIWSMDGTFELTVAGRRIVCSAALVPAGVRHSLDASGRVISLLLVESHGPRGAALDVVARRVRGNDLAQELAAVTFPSPTFAAHNVATLCDAVLSSLGVETLRNPITATTRRAIEYIERNLDGVPRVADIARTLSLSTTRVTHLFSREVGIPFRRFVLWTRIKRAVEAHRHGGDLTSAAIAAGFSDAAHFSRTFRAMFGLSPSLVLSTAEFAGGVWAG